MTDKVTATGRTKESAAAHESRVGAARDAEGKAVEAHQEAAVKAEAFATQRAEHGERTRMVLDQERQIRDGNIPDPDHPVAPVPELRQGKDKRATISSHSAAEKAGWIKVIDDSRDDAGNSNRPFGDYQGVHYEKQLNGGAVRASGANEEEALREAEAAEARSEAIGAGKTGVYSGVGTA